MSDDATTAADDAVGTVTPERLKERVDAGEDVFLLDVRSEDDYAEWHIGGESVESVNYPYFELLDGVPDDLRDALPDGRRVTVVCAKGGSSEMVAETLADEGYDADHLERGMKGWARLYEYDELDVRATTAASRGTTSGDRGAGSDVTVAQYRRPSSGCLAYLVVSDDEAAVIDPLRAFAETYVQDARTLGADLVYALDTHVHADHVSGVRTLADGTTSGATAVLPAAADARGVDYDVDYETVADGDVLEVGDVEIEAVHTPGHTTGMTTYRVGNVLFTGDGLFTESVARPDLEDPEAARDAARTLHASLRGLIERFDDDVIVAPAHYSDAATPNDDGTYTAALGDLVETMDALSMDEDAFVDYVVRDMPPRPANHESIIATNLGYETHDDESAFELELGPNNCAASEDAMTGE
ncbi:glyoxylase-like metal-dependent hydrolase (beta-lactamase superfamily II)/rhodanese-related sulfurtransferase [Halarchaeum rubridurum]|nr:MBL fold metallo-hydrolase [Halarchaeum rubridurum]MBP1954743.1 glyoxylase-like metal-dependent hydrolase (beta-lactamase superfamily II)/rhodanese-related sulfurtransferase [Halarchaeum rubridurum]